MTQPNILFIWTDQHRYDCIGAAGNPQIKTPHIDRLAESGIRFSNAYCPSPVCGPARAACFTGMYSPACGVVSNNKGFKGVPRLLTDYLFHSGYYNAMVGKLHLRPSAARHGFDWKRLCESHYGIYDREEVIYNDYFRFLERACYPDNPERAEEVASASETLKASDPRFWMGWEWVDEKHHPTTWMGDASVQFLENWQQEQPLFMNIGFFGPHHPYATCEPWDSLYDPSQITLPATLRIPKTGPVYDLSAQKWIYPMREWSDAFWQEMMAKYYGNISQIDNQIGRILDTLKARGMWENTLIIFTADHGDRMGDFGGLGKGDMYDSSAKIPFIVKPSGKDRNGEVRENVINTLDLFGTFLSAAGNTHWQEDERVESRSLLPLFENADADWNNETFSIFGGNPDKSLVMYRKDHLKLLGRATGADSAVYEMYDMTDPIPDVRDVFEDPQYHQERESMRSVLNAWWQKQRERYPGKKTSPQILQ